jgi:ankyrin repeat protein
MPILHATNAQLISKCCLHFLLCSALLCLLLPLCIINAQNERGISPLGVAVGFNQQEIVELLLAAGADLNIRDASSNTVLHYAAGDCCCTK